MRYRSSVPPQLILELVDGPTLADRIAHKPMPIDEVLAVARQMADALDAAHERGIVHRDLKPASIKLRGDGTVKVLDFGLAKAMDVASLAAEAAASGLTVAVQETRPGIVLGTTAYMSPNRHAAKSWISAPTARRSRSCATSASRAEAPGRAMERSCSLRM